MEGDIFFFRKPYFLILHNIMTSIISGYSGPTAAYSFKQLDPATTKTIFILGPSHHVRLSGCAVSQCYTYQTPLGDLSINREITNELLDTGKHN